MLMKNKYVIMLLSCFLSGCSVGHYEYSKETLSKADMNFVGIPTVLGVGVLGSSIPITPEYSLTAAHVARVMMYKVKSYHPTCDLALIYHKNNEKIFPNFKNSKIGDTIDMYGYSFYTAMPVKSEGKFLTNTIVSSEWNKKPCALAVSDAGVVQGMSGGAVYNKKDNSLTGVIEGYTHNVSRSKQTSNVLYKDVSLYVPYSRFSSWLEKEAGINQM